VAARPRHTHGDIRDVKHAVVIMQENRSFDHYFGSMKGVPRGGLAGLRAGKGPRRLARKWGRRTTAGPATGGMTSTGPGSVG
jgi:phospholipase C